MRRSIFAALLVLAVLVPAAMPATAAEPVEVQSVAGTIAAPTRFTDVDGGFPGLGRRLWLIAPQSNGVVSYTFNVDPASWGGKFDIKNVTDATGSPDLDIYFYRDFGNIPFAEQTGPESCTLADYAAGGPGETGFIPFGARKAIVFTPTAVNASFTYVGSSMPTIDIAGGDLNLTVPVGAFVGWRNNTGDYSFVRHVPSTASQPRRFDSSPGVATGLRNGEVFSYQFDESGTYRYETSTGTGTITVTDEGPGIGTPANGCT